MENPGFPSSLWETLDQRLWHATSSQGLEGILNDGEVRITGDRYTGSLSRHLRCVSLFDFGPTAVKFENQFEHMCGWLGHQQKSRIAIWLEVDRDAASDNILDAGTMHKIWKEQKKQLIPGFEAGHKGSIPLCRLKGALLIDYHDNSLSTYHGGVNEGLICELEEFEQSLPSPPPPHPLIAEVEDRRNRLREK